MNQQTKRTTKLKCPYCLDPNIFEKAFAARSEGSENAYIRRVRKIWRSKSDNDGEVVTLKEKAVTRGAYKIITITGDDLIDQWSDFRIEILGVKFSKEPPLPPPDQFFGESKESYYSHTTQRHLWWLYNILRITHSNSDVAIDVHWWPEHGRIVTIQDLPPAGPTNTELEIINEAVKLFRVETRGRGGVKITEERMKELLADAVPSISQKDVAMMLGVTEQGLGKWRSRQGMSSWREVVSKYSKPIKLKRT